MEVYDYCVQEQPIVFVFARVFSNLHFLRVDGRLLSEPVNFFTCAQDLVSSASRYYQQTQSAITQTGSRMQVDEQIRAVSTKFGHIFAARLGFSLKALPLKCLVQTVGHCFDRFTAMTNRVYTEQMCVCFYLHLDDLA